MPLKCNFISVNGGEDWPHEAECIISLRVRIEGAGCICCWSVNNCAFSTLM
jgi:hypothetical protein